MFFTFLLFSFATLLICGQVNDFEPMYNSQLDSLSTGDKIKRLQFNTSLGTSFFYSGAYGTGNEFFAAPGVNYGLTPRLSLHGGVIFSYTSFFNPQNEAEQGGSPMMSFPGMSVYGSANYQINEKLSFFGTGMKHIPVFFPGEENDLNNFNNYSFSLGSNYKIGRNVTIGASIHVNDRGSYYSPFSSPIPGAYYSPFDW